ncbi:MAG: hypothetical protein ABI724_17300 [Betaproteobacteria bacterium]
MAAFRFGMVRVPEVDFMLIADAMACSFAGALSSVPAVASVQ